MRQSSEVATTPELPALPALQRLTFSQLPRLSTAWREREAGQFRPGFKACPCHHMAVFLWAIGPIPLGFTGRVTVAWGHPFLFSSSPYNDQKPQLWVRNSV